DYHYNETPEFFYQVEGDMTLKIINDDNEFEDIPIKEGEIFLLPPKVPHSPQRYENTVGLVIEQKRPEGVNDALEWYCDNCGNKLYREEFPLTNIKEQLPKVFENYYSDENKRSCDSCGEVMEDRR
ncbi:MAG: 3-hydroxyanthranilate 3,4-dioxygenase, partial [Flavobacteriales bacterium]